MAGNIKGITIEIDGDTTKLDKALSNVTSRTKSVNSELRQVSGLLKFNPSSTELVAQKQQLLSQQIQNTSEKLQTLKGAQAQVDAQFKAGTLGEDKYRAFQRELIATEGSLKSYKGQLAASKAEQAALGTATTRLNGYFAASGRSVADFADILGPRLTRSIQSGTASASDISSAINKIGRTVTNNDKDFQEFNNILKKLDDGGSIDRVRADLTQLDKKTEDSGRSLGTFKDKLSFGAVAGAASSAMQTLTGGMGDLISQGVQASDAMDKFKSTMKFAGLGDKEIEAAGKAVQKYADDTVYDLGDVSNATAQLAANGVPHYTELTQAAGNLNAVAGGNADTYKSVTMVMTQTAGAGKLTTENFNQLADAIPGASGKLQEALKKNGAYTGNFRDAMEKGQITADEFNKAIMDLGMTDAAKKAATSTSTFEGAIGNLQANVVGGINDIIKSIGKANLTKLISTISNGLVGALKTVVNALKFVAQNADAFKSLAIAVGIFVAAIKVGMIINTFVTAIKEGKTAMMALNAVMGVNPFVLLIAGIAAVVAGLVYFFTQTKTGRQIWQSFVGWLKQLWQGIAQFFSQMWTSIKQIFTTTVNAIGQGINTAFTAIKNVIDTVMQAIRTGIGIAWNAIKAVFTLAITAIALVVGTTFNIIKGAIQLAMDGIKLVITTAWNIIKAVVTPIIEGFKLVITTAWNLIKTVTTTVFNAIKDYLLMLWNAIVVSVTPIINVIKTVITTVWNAISGVTTTVFNAVKDYLLMIWNAIVASVTMLINAIRTVITTVWNAISSITSSIWNTIKSVITAVWSAISSAVSNAINALRSVVTSVWNAISSVTSSVWKAIRSVISNVWSGIQSGVSNAINAVQSVISNIWNSIRSTTSNVWNGIKSAIEGPINTAKNIVGGAIDAIKGFFSFRISWPHIPMPHFAIRPSGWSIGDLLKGSIPSLGINWYAKGGIMTKPTMFSSNGSSVNVGGEAGPEAILPLNEKNLSMIGKAIAENMEGSGVTVHIDAIYGAITDLIARQWADKLAVAMQRAAQKGDA